MHALNKTHELESRSGQDQFKTNICGSKTTDGLYVFLSFAFKSRLLVFHRQIFKAWQIWENLLFCRHALNAKCVWKWFCRTFTVKYRKYFCNLRLKNSVAYKLHSSSYL